ncbi:uncharacterized protein LOC116412912 [Galleria mellonella]|uniref:Uncharacterized protein LOC116412912 n=1 Tax=Galleria mellonella TaxID=7137 RepID=A0A6J3C224_GALME|nr:uncharacterized protein LOC116412912 [Galleria mellonella]
MARLVLIVAAVCLVEIFADVPSHPTYLYSYSEHRGSLKPLKATEEVPSNAYEYHVIPKDEYPVVEYDSTAKSSIFDYITDPITAITTVASKALSVGKFLLVNGGLVVLGMALVIGFCGFTPYCTLKIEKPFVTGIRSLNIPYLDHVESYLRKAYDKYHAMQH